MCKFPNLIRILSGTFVALCANAFGQTTTNTTELIDLSNRLGIQARADKAYAESMAKILGLPIRQVLPGGAVLELMKFTGTMPVYYATSNLNAAKTVRTNTLWSGGGEGLNLNGTGILLGIWDGGSARATHQEFTGRLTVMDGAGIIDHATHVSGTMIAVGKDPNAHGMANNAHIHSYDWNSDASEMATAAAGGLRLSNHSYGFLTGWQHYSDGWYWYGDTTVNKKTDATFGYYDNVDASWDQIAYNAPYYLICKAAGNDRLQGPAQQPIAHYYWDGSNWTVSSDVRDLDGGPDGYDSVVADSTFKNGVTVAAVDDIPGGWTQPSDVVMSSFSGWGPTDDGRIKPDWSANGVNLWSSIGTADNAYDSYSGTSMATPNTTGSLGLLIQHYRNLHNSADMRSATLKGLCINTTDEAGANPGPDYAFGWGLLDVRTAARTITDDLTNKATIMEGSLKTGEVKVFQFNPTGGPLRFTICWTDPAATPHALTLNDRTRMLVNDLDIRVKNGSTTYYPWTLNPGNPSAPAVPGNNILDNVERVDVTSASGPITVSVSAKGTLKPQGAQAFSLIVTGAQSVAPALSTLVLNPTTVVGGHDTTGTVSLTNNTTRPSVVTLSSASSVIVPPASVTVAPGEKSATAAIHTLAVASSVSRPVTATLNGVTRSAMLTLTPEFKLVSLGVSPSSVLGGDNATGTVTMSFAATSDTDVALSSSSAVIVVPASTKVIQGQTTSTFTVATKNVATAVTRSFSATYNGVTKTANLTINPNPVLTSMVIVPSSVKGGTNATGTVTLNFQAPLGGSVVNLSSNSSVIVVPASVTVAAGQSSANFVVNTKVVTQTYVRTVTASRNGVSKTFNLTITP